MVIELIISVLLKTYKQLYFWDSKNIKLLL